jgi:DNA repair protein RadC
VICLRKSIREENNLKDSHFDGFEYKGYRVKTKLVIEGHKEYKPIKLSNAHDVYETFRKLVESDKEKFYSIFLDCKNKVIGVDMVSQGCLDSSLVHPREVYKSALLASASNVIFVHGHPSGEPDPSFSDREITKLLKQAGELLQIGVLDHIIIGMNQYYSFADRGEL